jgi:hypothetical protein
MNPEDVRKRIRAHGDRLEQLGVRSLALFGSVARGESQPNSDVDFLVEFDGPATFDAFMELKLFLEDLLDRRVDLVTQRGLRDEIRQHVEKDLLRVA